MNFKKYPKIHRLGKDETAGILHGTVHVEEKIDGQNVSIWMEDGELHMGSRNKEVTEGFNGFCDYVRNHEGIKKVFEVYPNYRLYGEWLVRHTISYNETAYKQFYLFDITEVDPELGTEKQEPFFEKARVLAIAESYDILAPKYHGTFVNPSESDFEPFMGKSELGEEGEGVVLKNPDFRDMFGNHNYAKIVTESFKENNGVTFGGNNKHSDTYWEVYIINKYMTLARVEKVMHKIQPIIDEKLDLKHTARVINTAYHDMLTEEVWEIAQKVGTVDFKSLKRVSMKKAAQIYKDKLSGDISVADKMN